MSSYTSKSPDADGRYAYCVEEDAVWGHLFERQMTSLKGKVIDEYLTAVNTLGLNKHHVPQIRDIDARLTSTSGAGVEGVPAIIPPNKFFALLAQRKFPVATFLRRPEHMDYIEEPDLFHEVFGHCPLLTNTDYADFIEGFGQQALTLGKGYSWHLFRLFWFTVEFGMIRTADGLRAYGAGIVSSPAELKNAMGDTATMIDFDLITALRTPYRIDIVQPAYFVIDSFADLAALLEIDFKTAIDEAKSKGDFAPLYEVA
ncbi:MAG: phenylalanine 4-monooxygenase [Pseudoruegeria sp.]